MSPPASTNSLLLYTDGNRLFNAKPAMRFWSPIYFFTDSWATVIFCGRLFCPRQSEYSGILEFPLDRVERFAWHGHLTHPRHQIVKSCRLIKNPNQHTLRAFEDQPDDTEQAQVTFVSALTASAFGLAATGGIDYGWNSFENAFKNAMFFNARRK